MPPIIVAIIMKIAFFGRNLKRGLCVVMNFQNVILQRYYKIYY